MPTKTTRPKRTATRRPGASSPAPAGTGAATSLRDKAYDTIKHRIITCSFRPGEYINELQLSALLKIGRTPVHQALDRLMIEGMVEVIPRKGAFIRPVSLEEILNVIDVRLVNEMHCVRLAVARASDVELAELSAVLDRADTLVPKRDIEGLMLLDREFHLRLSRAARNPVLAELLLSLHERSLRFWFISLSDDQHLLAVLREHREIAGRLRERDAEGACAAMRAHIESFHATIVQSSIR
jgi:DNA-binding GntR family transcriptional regulator